MIFKPDSYFDTGCGAYLIGCGNLGACAVADGRETDGSSGHPSEELPE